MCVYGHLDVQPAALEDGWDSEPFTLVERDGEAPSQEHPCGFADATSLAVVSWAPTSHNRWPLRDVEVRFPQVLAGAPVLETSQRPLCLRKRGLVALGQLRFPPLLAGLRT